MKKHEVRFYSSSRAFNPSLSLFHNTPLGKVGYARKKNSFWMAATRLAIATITLIAIPMLAIAAEAAGAEKVLYEFTGGTDGDSPRHSLIFDASGALYGTTFDGGTYGAGTVYTLIPNSDGSWTESVLYSFSGGADGGYPDWGSLTFDSAGNLYGVTYGGGQYGVGTIFELTPNSDGSWTEHALHQFTGKDGAQPRTKPIFDAKGNFYGAATYGGAHGCGAVFKMTPGSNNTWTYSVIHQFMDKPGCIPWVGLIADTSGNFYGTTRNQIGGCSNPPLNCGEVFELTPGSDEKWIYKIIHKFSGGKGGSEPVFGLIFGEDGTLYGAARTEGAYSAGLFYKLTPSAEGKWSYQVLHQFKKNVDGDLSEGVLASDALGNLYGTAGYGGLYGNGTLYQMAPDSNNTWTFSVLHNFGGSGDGAAAIPGPISDAAGNLYGVTPNGGTYGAGMVYEITP